MMWVSGVARSLRRPLQRAARGRNPVILMYHRIADSGEDPWGLAVSPANFAAQIEVLLRHRRVMRLGDLASGLRSGTLPPDVAVVSFDDGYAESLRLAKPLLERRGVPATVFVVAGALGGVGEFWWDELGALLLQPGSVPQVLELQIGGETRRWALAEARDYHPDDAAAHRAWRVGQPASTLRHSLYLDLWRLLHPLPECDRARVLMRLRRWTGSASPARSQRRSLNESELLAMCDGDLIEIGAHGLTHAPLPGQPEALLQREIRHAKAVIEDCLGHRIAAFAYPYGAFDAPSVAAVRDAGFSCACTTEEDVVRPGADPLRLPRIAIRNWDGDEFGRRLSARFVA